MSKRVNVIIGLGASAIVIATPFIVSSFRMMGNKARTEKTMMEKGVFSDNVMTDCECEKRGQKCECKHAHCQGSCGGGGEDASCGENTCKGK